MSIRGNTRYCFVSSFTSLGFRTFIPDLVDGIKKVFILKGAPGTGKSTFIRLVGETLSEQGYDIEYWVSSLDPVTPDGVYIPQLDTAVVNGSLKIPVDPQYPQVREIMINLGEYCQGIAAESFRTVTELLDSIKASQEQAVHFIQASTEARQEIRHFNSIHLDTAAIQVLIDEISGRIMDYRPAERHYFARTLTPDGMADYIDDLSRDCQQRYIFKGCPGSGGSIVIAQLISQAREKGYWLEYYHCGLEYDQLVMVIIRSLQVALIETDQVDIESRQGDKVIDMQKYLHIDSSDPFCFKCSETSRLGESLLLQAQQELGNVKKQTRLVKKYYCEAMDFERLDQKRAEVIRDILKIG
ncbi:MAG TPA: hypothetical protein P5309_03035 [Syntrophomonadaceae bacterium]|mgnify:CR=1 FL=1|nr:hypothetical protein [Syntrophomonadaceae bacterium]